MRQVQARLTREYEDRFLVGSMSMQGVVLKDDDPPEAFLDRVPRLFRDSLGFEVPQPGTWAEWTDIFKAKDAYQDKVAELFGNPELEFSIDEDWCNYLYRKPR
ncbi:MAG: hypothetical protein KGY41_07655 [Desulfovermiculus sp.]|nr:hypothetical protein [Desulfovermiculus sp.]